MVPKYLEIFVFSAIMIWHLLYKYCDGFYFCHRVDNVRFTCMDSSLRGNFTSASAIFLWTFSDAPRCASSLHDSKPATFSPLRALPSPLSQIQGWIRRFQLFRLSAVSVMAAAPWCQNSYAAKIIYKMFFSYFQDISCRLVKNNGCM